MLLTIANYHHVLCFDKFARQRIIDVGGMRLVIDSMRNHIKDSAFLLFANECLSNLLYDISGRIKFEDMVISH